MISRRALLTGAAAATLVSTAGCGAFKKKQPPATVTDLVSTDPFYIAHRGGGDNWPEMTAFAYEQAAKLPYLKAIEISVCQSADGVLVCSHDPTTLRMTGVDYTIAQQPWSTLAELKVTAAFTGDPTQPSRPFSRFDEVLAAHVDQLVVFVEPKTAAAVEPLMKTMAALNQPERVVWKQPINQPNFGTAKSHGFTTWGYVLNEPGHLGTNLQRYAASAGIDMLGVQRSLSDAILQPVVAAAKVNKKKSIIWNIRNVDDRTRGLRLGCEGMMTSNIAEVPTIPV